MSLKHGTSVGSLAGGQEREERIGELKNVARCKQGLTNQREEEGEFLDMYDTSGNASWS